MKPESKKIDLVVSDKSVKTKASKIIREYAKRSYHELIEAVENAQPLFTAELKPEDFYSGIKEFVTIIEKFDAEKISYTIFINGKLETKETVLEIEKKVQNITMKDFR